MGGSQHHAERPPHIHLTVCLMPLTVCVFGSSSSRTPLDYMVQAKRMGQLLAEAGITCINGAGTAGVMGSLNEGLHLHNGKVIGVTHEMWDNGGKHSFFQLVVASGKNLAVRKELLLEKADCFIVLPGGPGTFDELWEVLSEKQMGLRNHPVVIVNLNGYFEGTILQLKRAMDDGILYIDAAELVQIVDNVDQAVEFCLKGTSGGNKNLSGFISERNVD